MTNIQPAIFIVPIIALILVIVLYISLSKKSAHKEAFKRFILTLAVVAFLLNYVWELAHMPLYKDASFSAQHIAFCGLASVADALMVLLLYLGVAFFYKKPFWVQGADFQQIIRVMTIGGIGAIIGELAHTSAGDWSYADSMPMIPFVHVGLTPILQFLILPTLTYFLSLYFLKKTSKKEVLFISI